MGFSPRLSWIRNKFEFSSQLRNHALPFSETKGMASAVPYEPAKLIGF
jgi:hypothetical protein